ncbi:MAG: nickel pincer cofactor biosynthesis protein LarC [Chthoniobacteraceae bacterium]|nr:nickel pincer cofactor biosynthesis protein LarC [Chthoniobacteraceae bacterium]
MRTLFLDCISGISGDMMVGALCDLGVKPSALEWELSQLELGDFHMHFERQERQHISGIHFSIHGGNTHRPEQDAPCACGHEHPHEHEHEHHHGHEHPHEHGHSHEHSHEEESHRTYAQIRALLASSELSAFVKKHALSMFHRIAVAEAKIHGKPVEEVAFHEVGALDSIADIVCVCTGIEALGVEEVRFSPLADGRGTVETAHGTFPVPAPATLEILAGIPVGQMDVPFELITPTGAAIAAEFGRSFGLMPALRIEKIGYGLGSRSLPNRPNALRAILGEAEAEPAGPYLRDTIVRVETNLDDLSPEITGAVLSRLLEAGALDATLSPLQMKKNRPGVLLTVLCEEGVLEKIAALLFAETSAFGIRMDRVERWKLDRRLETVSTPYGEIIVKRGLAGGKIVQTAPEFESCRAASERTGQPLRVIYEAALRAAVSDTTGRTDGLMR